MRRLTSLIAALMLAACASAGAPNAPADYTAVLADPVRTTEDRTRDDARKTAETLTFAGVRPGQHVADMIIGEGYFTRVFSAAVGPEGRVTAWQPAEFIGFGDNYRAAIEAADALPNVDAIRSPLGAPAFPSGLDLIFTAQNYHDLHLKPFAAGTASQVNTAAFRALRPGGLYVVVDHHATAGSGLPAADSLHRIDPALVIEEVTAAGFELDGRSEILARADDLLTANVFDEGIRGRTSQFMLRFRKPG